MFDPSGVDKNSYQFLVDCMTSLKSNIPLKKSNNRKMTSEKSNISPKKIQ